MWEINPSLQQNKHYLQVVQLRFYVYIFNADHTSITISLLVVTTNFIQAASEAYRSLSDIDLMCKNKSWGQTRNWSIFKVTEDV